MNFKKKRSFWELLRAGLVVLFCFVVPVWLLVVAMITESAGWCVALIGWALISWIIFGRVEKWEM